MKLNIDIIKDRLPETCRVKRFGPSDRKLSFGRPLLYQPGEQLIPGRLYIAAAEVLDWRTDAPRSSAFICCGRSLTPEWMASGNQLLLVAGELQVYELFRVVQEIYDRFDDWECRLRDELENDVDFDIRRILSAGVEMLENPIGVTDHALQGILLAEIVSSENEELRVKVNDSPFPLPLESGEAVKKVCHIERSITVPYFTTAAPIEHRAYCNNLYPLGHFTGCVYVSESQRPFRDSDFPLADYFFTGFFQKAFLKYLRDYGQTVYPGLTALRALLSHSQLSHKDLAELTLAPDERWVCFRLKEKRSKQVMPKDYMYATLSALMPRKAYAVIDHGEIVGLLRLSGQSLNAGILESFQDILSRMGYIGGLSNEFADIRQIDAYLLQAAFTAERGAERDTDDSVCFFSDCFLPYMLSACSGKLPPETLYSKGLQILLDYDRRKGTDYIKTLDYYLKNETSITKTAEALFIHRSSLQKRLDKICRLTGESLDDPDIRLYYRICFKLWELGLSGTVPSTVYNQT